MYKKKVTMTNGNGKNRIPGSRIRFSIYDENGTLVEMKQMYAPYSGIYYVQNHPRGRYAKEFWELMEWADKRVDELNKPNELNA